MESDVSTAITPLKVNVVSNVQEAEARGLSPWKPGQSGNPSGRPKRPLSDRLLKELAKNGELEISRVIGALLNHATSLDAKSAGASVKAITEIFDRVEGKVPQAVTGADGGPLEFVLITENIGRSK